MPEQSLAGVDPQTRHALYYPYIHIRDENWLKGTILSFQQVRRMVPHSFTVKDQAISHAYSKLEGPAGKLLESLEVEGPEILATQEWLRGKMEARIDDLKALRYTEDDAPAELEGGPEAFEMHAGKFLDHKLLEFLLSQGLGWYSREPSEPDSSNWITMHPKVGAAMMSVLALTVARVKGLSVVTPSRQAHHELLAGREEEVFEKLLEVPLPPASGQQANVTVEELSQVVITMGFDLTRLTPQQICELLKEGKDLRKFRAAVAGFAGRIPPGLDGAEREKRLRKEAQAVLDEWHDYTKKLPAFAKESLVDAALDKVPDQMIELGLSAGIATAATLAALPALAIGIVVAAGIKMFRRPDTPLRFLTRVDKVVDRSIGSIYVPQWSTLGGQMPSQG